MFSVPQSAEGARRGGARGGAAGLGDPHAGHAAAHGGRQHHAHALDQEDHRRGRTLHAAAVPYTPVGRQALQGDFAYAAIVKQSCRVRRSNNQLL